MKTAAIYNKKVNLSDSEEICIIDDAPIPMAITKKICQRILPQIPIKTFETVDKALTYLSRNESINRTIFVDLHMPHKNGWQFLQSFTPGASDTIFILSSSKEESDIAQSKLFPVVTEYLFKPLSIEKMASFL